MSLSARSSAKKKKKKQHVDNTQLEPTEKSRYTYNKIEYDLRIHSWNDIHRVGGFQWKTLVKSMMNWLEYFFSLSLSFKKSIPPRRFVSFSFFFFLLFFVLYFIISNVLPLHHVIDGFWWWLCRLNQTGKFDGNK